MPFAQYLKPDDVEAIRAYVMREAQHDKQRLGAGDPVRAQRFPSS